MPWHEQETLRYHLRCTTCDYDLFGHNYQACCPECGTPVLMSICSVIEHARLKFGSEFEGASRVAVNTHHKINAVNFTLTAIRYNAISTIAWDHRTTPQSHEIDGGLMCYSIGDLAIAEFGHDASNALIDWKIGTFDQVRTMLTDLVKYGALNTPLEVMLAELDAGPRLDPSKI